MSMNRRKFLMIAGGAGVIVAAGGAGFVATRTPTDALAPWQSAGSAYADPMRRALSYAILAPNPHNRQPWIIDIKSDSEAVLTCDLDRLLPETDPFDRQIVIGLGCFLELFSMAAADQGYRADVRYFPEGQPGERLDQRPIAHLSLVKQEGLASDPLFAAVLDRHTNRDPYDTERTVDAAVLQRMARAAGDTVILGSTNGGDLLQELRVLTRDAMFTEMRTPEAHHESVDLMRIGRSEIEANPDGIVLQGALIEALNLVGIVTRESIDDPSSSSFQMGLDMFDEAAMTAMGFVWINTAGNDRLAQIDAGRAYMRVSLQAAADGLAMQPMSQALQEYSAMAPFYETVHNKLADRAGERVQMLARLGYAKFADPAPRWPLETRLKNS